MKANELMVGDWVQDITPVVIDAISNEDICTYRDENGYKTANPNNLKPIPLTAEILERNGFEVQDQGGGRKDVWRGFGPDCEGDIEIEFNNGIPTHLKIDGCFKGEYYTSTNTKSVHELQHALRLCGIDKEIVL